MPFSYASPTSGPSAGGIGWFNFNSFTTISPGQTITGLTGTLNDGSTVTFDLTASNVAGGPRPFDAVAVPTYPGAQFANSGYTSIAGTPALYTPLSNLPGANRVTLSNIVVLDNLGNPVPNYTAVVADAESTGAFENWTWDTNGGGWVQLTKLGVGTSPVLTGLGTPTATLTGNNTLDAAYVLTTQNPTQLQLTTTTNTTSGGREAVAIGFATTHIRLQKNIAGRINSADQFQLDVTGTPSGTATTTGATSGIQTQSVNLFSIPGNSYVINESMAPGSVSPLTSYTKVVSAANSTPAGSVPPTGNLPITFTPALGDDVTYTILNIAPEVFTKTVDKAFADLGEIVTYSVQINNPNNFAINNVLVNDPTPSGTTFILGSLLVVGSAFTGTNPNSGVTLTSIPANTTATLTWQVQVNSLPPISNPVTNVAMVMVPDGTSGPTNAVTTQVNTAYVTVNKVTNLAFGEPGDIITYTLILNNAGNVAANNVVLTDAIPAGTTFVPGSLVGATGTPPTLTLTNPIPAGGNTIVTFQVKVGAGMPVPNPLQNSASVAYTYTVDPANPNGATGARNSNVVETEINTAKLVLSKTVDKSIAYLNDIITYQIAVTNTGNVPADNVIITDLLASGLSYVPGSILINVPSTGDPTTSMVLTNPVLPQQIVTISFKAVVNSIPNPNPAANTADASYAYTVNPINPNGVTATSASNTVHTLVFRNNFSQQITDLIESVALEQAALAAIAQAEGAKIQRLASMPDVTPQQLLCLNKSVTDMTDSIALLETVLRKKLSVLDCQISGGACV